ncbi:hydroxyacylglutathione hydrolase [Pelagibacterium limicola]|uniref:hydroxyacylglutathione hydrolase n=1 Tax=Pelagibacterium limicola TaxID=2791022 RepID=UPI0018AF874B|nr:hydroxyacylglutathione hydrolase [Pelagibacterium limicola]
MSIEIELFPALETNYGVLIRDTATGTVAAIDAPETGPILAALDRRGWDLDIVLITHHHPDHTDAILPLKKKFGATVYGPRGEKDKIEGLDHLVSGGDSVRIGETAFAVIDVPGHTLGHIAYHSRPEKLLFAADALFSLGVGRMFEGNPEMMWEGLLRLRALDPETRLYCGHEYTLSNAAFALSVDPDNAALKARAQEAQNQIDNGEPTIPSLLASEIAANPFLRADDPAIAKAMKLEGAPAAEVFGALRKAKDNF